MKTKNTVRCASAVALLLTTISITLNAAPPPGYTKIWEDNFDGAMLNAANWTIGLEDPATGDLVPGALGASLLNNSYAGYITPEDVVVSGGALTLTNQKRTYQGTDPVGTFQYTSGWIMSMHKVHFNGGTTAKYVEFRAKFPSGPKVWPALWMGAEGLSWPPEWDLWEYFGYLSGVGYDVMGNHLATGPSWRRVKWYSHWISNFDAIYDGETWHTYGWEWTPNGAVWYLDGVEVHRLAKTLRWPNTEMYLILNNGVKTDSPEGNTVYPNALVIDYVQVWSK